MQGSITRFVKRKDGHTLELDEKMLNMQKGGCSSLQESKNHQLKEIVCYNLETELIEKQPISTELKEDFVQKI